MCGIVCGVETNALGFSYKLLGFPWTAEVPVGAEAVQKLTQSPDVTLLFSGMR